METLTETKIPSASNAELEALCLELAQVDQESDVIDLLKKWGLWDDESAWQNYGDKENNFSDIGNQMESADTALVEKLINSGDALLLGKCIEEGLEPESEDAPNSIPEGLKRFFKIPNGKLSGLDAGSRATLSKNIGLVASGSKGNPSFAVYDKGIGQSPSLFPSTFLSLTQSNKMRIQFVQGRFNMGSTGVLQFCGKQNIQLIISRAQPTARHETADGEKWGFTVVRREDPKGQMKSSVFTYLAPEGQVLSFSADSIPVLPGEYPNATGNPMEYGSYVKMYEYDIGPGLRTNILFDLYNRLSLLVPGIALPVRLYERRSGYSGHSFETNLAGLTTRLEDDKLANLEPGYPSDCNITVSGHKMKVNIYAFKRGARKKYSSSEGVIFSLHGQTHGALSTSFFSRKNVGMSYLANDLLVLVDCSEIDGRSREDLFMNSRDRLRNGSLKAEIEKDLTTIIHNHEGLRALREKRKKEALADKLGDSKPIADILSRVLKSSPVLSALLGTGTRITDPFKTTGTKSKDDFVGRKFPTYFTPTKEYPKTAAKDCHDNSKFRVQYETDASNNYFNRDNDPGEFELLMDGTPTQDCNFTLWQGHFNLTVDLPGSATIGDIFKFTLKVNDSSRVQPMEHSFWVKKVGPKAPGGGGGKKKKASNKKAKGNNTGPSQLDVPPVAAIHKDQWDEYDFDKYTALEVKHSGEGDKYDFFYNADNIYLKSEQKVAADDEAEIVDTQYKSALVLIGLAMLREETNDGKKENDSPNSDETTPVDKNIATVTKALSPVLLPMIRSLGSIKIDE